MPDGIPQEPERRWRLSAKHPMTMMLDRLSGPRLVLGEEVEVVPAFLLDAAREQIAELEAQLLTPEEAKALTCPAAAIFDNEGWLELCESGKAKLRARSKQEETDGS
jgi:hypothetical protein